MIIEPTIATLATDICNIKEDTAEIKKDVKGLYGKLDTEYISCKQFEAEFNPVRNLVYGLVGLILTIVVTALVYLVVIKGG